LFSARPRPTQTAVLALFAVGSVAEIAHLIAGDPVTSHVYEFALCGIAVLLPIYAIRRAQTERSAAWWAVSAFALTVAISQIGWTAVGQVMVPSVNTEMTPFDSVYLVGAALGAVGLVVITFRGLRRDQAGRVISDCLVLSLAGYLIWWTVTYRLAGATAPRGSDLVFPVVDVAMAAITLTATIYQPRRRALVWLTIATLCAAGVDSVSTAMATNHTAVAMMAMLWLAALCGFALFIEEPDDARTTYPVTMRRRAATYLIAAVAVAVVVVGMIVHGGVDQPSFGMGVAMVLAIIANQFLVFREIKSLADSNREALEALSASEARFRVAFEGAPVGLLVIEDRCIVEVNPAIGQVLGVSADRLVGQRSDWIVSKSIVPHVRDDEWSLITPSIEGARREFPWKTPDGQEKWLNLTVSRLPGTAGSRVIAIIEDITDQRAANTRLADLAVRDPLTGLANRAAFADHLDEALSRSDSRGVAVAFLDLDRFKVINDSLGHAVGDQILAILGERIDRAVGDHGMVARFAGDEFTIVVGDADRATVAEIMEGVLITMQQPIELDDGMMAYPTCSIGVSWGLPGDPPNAVLARADAAMYRAKERGRNRVEFYDEVQAVAATAQLRLMGELHHALDHQEFVLLYQPIVDLLGGETLGFEALIRWRHPERGLLLPGDFIEAAEESGLIVPMGSWVIEEALRQLASLDRALPGNELTMSVNVAARQVSEDLVGVLEDALALTGADPSRLWLEITESTLMTDTRLATSVLSEIRRTGVRIAVDDFGTGYSSMTYLQRFPVAGIKVDRSFVDGLGRHDHAQAICQAVVSLGHALDLHVVAEGVETLVQREALAAMGCRLAQGYLFGRPEAAESAVQRLCASNATAVEAQ
jgi:diguanylate cyclase (GGDEF)-like protein/PAS domain S-box-containing protein